MQDTEMKKQVQSEIRDHLEDSSEDFQDTQSREKQATPQNDLSHLFEFGEKDKDFLGQALKQSVNDEIGSH